MQATEHIFHRLASPQRPPLWGKKDAARPGGARVRSGSPGLNLAWSVTRKWAQSRNGTSRLGGADVRYDSENQQANVFEMLSVKSKERERDRELEAEFGPHFKAQDEEKSWDGAVRKLQSAHLCLAAAGTAEPVRQEVQPQLWLLKI